ncbi:hypothetical protein IFR05_014883 [Cadophora sp. M221]|nr:hypothetical protein IFR05_014883 [Cadophora sp. M221]
MSSIAFLLNPVGPEEPVGTGPPSSASWSPASTHSSLPPSSSTLPSSKKPKMSKDGPVFIKSKIKGEVNFPAFDHLDERAQEELRKFQILPVGNIHDFPRHIPYNSEKKRFLEKTGRESFEVFQYTYRFSPNEKDHLVMWDYNIGLVRITPFFKSCLFTKTAPAKMLGMNPGLKEITHSITGGALAAQGYWMPYSCARAVCAKFCAPIAGALIPIFGPNFPSQCVPPESPEFGQMTIDAQIIREATIEAEVFRNKYRSSPVPRSFTRSSTGNRESYPPSYSHGLKRMSSESSMRCILPLHGRSSRIKRDFDGDSHYGSVTDTDFETESSSDRYLASSSATPASTSNMLYKARSQSHSVAQPSYIHGPVQGGGGRGAQVTLPSISSLHNLNMASHIANSSLTAGPGNYQTFDGPNPLLSAIPRSTGLPVAMSHPFRPRPIKRRAEEVDAGDECAIRGTEGDGTWSGSDKEMSVGGVDKKAAWLLLKLSAMDRDTNGGMHGAQESCCRGGDEREVLSIAGLSVAEGTCTAGPCIEGSRIKRRRATPLCEARSEVRGALDRVQE